MITEEEKKAGIWEFNGKKFKRCPKCDKAILAEWKSHGCSWGKDEIVSQSDEGKIEEASQIVYGCIKEAISVLDQVAKETKEVFYNLDHILNVADQIRRLKLADLIRKK